MTGEMIGYIFGVILFAISAGLCFRKCRKDPLCARIDIIFGIVFSIGSLICLGLLIGKLFFAESTDMIINAIMQNIAVIYAAGGLGLLALFGFLGMRRWKD